MFKVIIHNLESILPEELKEGAFAQFACQGILENQLEEEAVDALLAEESFCGGEVPLHVLQKLENVAAPNPTYFFESHAQAVLFADWAKNNFHLESSVVEEPEKDWNAEWKKHYAPILVGKDFWIIPSWAEVQPDTKHIKINPGQGFGTGSHATTSGCLEALLHFQEQLKNPVASALDFGCGSGILGIAYLELIQGPVDFCDVDKDALENCKENIELNDLNLSEHRIILRNKFKPKHYDVIFANILLNILIEESETIKSCLKPGGLIFFSGILEDQVEELVAHYQSKFSFKEELRLKREQWMTLVLRRL